MASQPVSIAVAMIIASAIGTFLSPPVRINAPRIAAARLAIRRSVLITWIPSSESRSCTCSLASWSRSRSARTSDSASVRAEMKSEFQAVRGDISALQRTTFQLFAGVMVTLALGFGGMIVALLTQS